MTYSIRFGKSAAREFRQLPRETRGRIATQIDSLAADPRPRRSQALRGKLKGLRKLRVGDHRVVYEVDDEARVVQVWSVAHRRDAYSRMARRLR